MDDTETAILLATIEEGGSAFPSAFQTAKVAKRSGVSEYALYDRYKSKAALLNAADLYLSAFLFDYALKAAQADQDFNAFFTDLMLFQVRHPSWNGFWLNYSSIFPRVSLAKEETEAVVPLPLLKALGKYFPDADYGALEKAFRFLSRESISFARYVIYSEVPGNEHRLLAESQIVYGGLAAFKIPLKK
jgi:AcrR family transcriptional regulator